jgi:hypothetical protein
VNSPEAVFDSRLGGRDKHGSQFRDSKTGRFVPKVPPCPPHYWLINSQNVGYCKKCGQVKDFGKELKKALKREFLYPPYMPEPKY